MTRRFLPFQISTVPCIAHDFFISIKKCLLVSLILLLFEPISNDSSMFFCFTGYSLKCYKFTTLKDWDDCETKKVETSCASGSDSCGTIFLDGEVAGVSLKTYYKDCTVKAGCNKDLCKQLGQTGATIKDCEVDCCEGDLCNGAKVLLVSAILLLACAFLAFFR